MQFDIFSRRIYQRISVAFGITNRTDYNLKILLFHHSFTFISFQQILLLEIFASMCILCMYDKKYKKKKKTLLNCSGSLCHIEMFVDGHIFRCERLFLESRHRMWCSSGRTCVLWSLTSDSSLWPTVDLKIQDYSICTLYIVLYYRNTIVLVYEWCRDENPVYLQ